MKTPFLISLLFLLHLLSLPCVAYACRPFGSYGFAEDKNGGIWFTEGDSNAISRLSMDGTVTSHLLPTPAAEPSSIAVDGAGNVWFTEMDGRQVGRLTPDGKITEYPVHMGQPFQIAADANGDAWFTVLGEHRHNTDGQAHQPAPSGIGRLGMNGRLDFYPVPSGWPSAIAFDSQGQVWVTLQQAEGNKGNSQGWLLRLTRDGQWHEERHWATRSCPRNLVPDHRGGIYFSDGCRNSVSYRSSNGTLRERYLPKNIQIQGLSLGSHGRLWFTDRAALEYLDPQGRPIRLRRPVAGDATMAVLALSNGEVVYSEIYNYNINRRTRDGHFVEYLIGIDYPQVVQEPRGRKISTIEYSAPIVAKAEMERRRVETVNLSHFQEDGLGTEKLVAGKCFACHDAHRLLLARRSDWSGTIERMQSYRGYHGLPLLNESERNRLISYFNTYYGLR